MNRLFKEVKDINTEACVSIILNTHRTRPDNEKDPILLKNLAKEALERLYADYDKRFVWPIEENLNSIVEKINHHENIESLIIYVNQKFADYTRLPVPVKDRVIIDNTFATRDLVRASYEEGGYYALQLSRSVARLIEAYNGKVVAEVGGEFPFENSLESRGSIDVDNESTYIREYFNHVDKALQAVLNEHPLPVILVTEDRNYDYFLEVSDNTSAIVGNINRLPNDEKADKVIAEAWPEVSDSINQQIAARIEELSQAKSTDSVVTGYNEVWQTIQQGRAKTLFIKKGFIQPAVVDEENFSISLIDDPTEDPNAVDDIVDEMIEQTIAYGGDLVFIKDDALEEYDNLAVITRD